MKHTIAIALLFSACCASIDADPTPDPEIARLEARVALLTRQLEHAKKQLEAARKAAAAKATYFPRFRDLLAAVEKAHGRKYRLAPMKDGTIVLTYGFGDHARHSHGATVVLAHSKRGWRVLKVQRTPGW